MKKTTTKKAAVKKTTIYEVEKIVRSYRKTAVPGDKECLIFVKHDEKTNDLLSICIGNAICAAEIVGAAMDNDTALAETLVNATMQYIARSTIYDFEVKGKKRKRKTKQ